MDERATNALLALLARGRKGPEAKAEALEAISLRPVWLATWEPRAEGFRTLINTSGEEALAVFSSEDELEAAAAQFDWLEEGTVSTHRAIGGDILRHAWTREYAFVVIDIASTHSLEYGREELKTILREMDSTGPFRTSRPPPPAEQKAAAGAFPIPDAKPAEPLSTVYSMSPSHSERLDRLSDLPTKPHDLPYDSEPPTEPRAALPDDEPPTRPRAALPERKPGARRRKSSRPARESKRKPLGPKIEEVPADFATLGEGGTYGAASVIPPSLDKPQSAPPARSASEPSSSAPKSARPISSRAPKLNSDAPTAPAAEPIPSLDPGKLKLPAVGPIGSPSQVEPELPDDGKKKPKPSAPTPEPPLAPPPRVVAPSIGDGIKLAELYDPPDDSLLESLGKVLRRYFEVEWASYCHVARPSGDPSPAVGLRIADDYRDNVTLIIKELCEAGRAQDVELDVLLIDGHDLLRKAREKAFVFYPWKPKA